MNRHIFIGKRKATDTTRLRRQAPSPQDLADDDGSPVV